jgi:O-acetylserine/cysteine efflux transporter
MSLRSSGRRLLISSVLFLGDRMIPKLIVGGLLAISGIAITQVRPGARPI